MKPKIKTPDTEQALQALNENRAPIKERAKKKRFVRKIERAIVSFERFTERVILATPFTALCWLIGFSVFLSVTVFCLRILASSIHFALP